MTAHGEVDLTKKSRADTVHVVRHVICIFLSGVGARSLRSGDLITTDNVGDSRKIDHDVQLVHEVEGTRDLELRFNGSILL